MATSTPVKPGRARSRTQKYRQEFEQELPRIERHARIAFRDVFCCHRREDCIAEVIALSWQWWLRLRKRGKNPLSFVSAIAKYAARSVRSGRRVCGQEPSQDVLSPKAQGKRGFTVRPLPAISTMFGNVFEEALHDNMQTPVDEQVAFRLDFPAWFLTHTDRNRRIIADLMTGQQTQEVSRTHGTTPGRVSQLRAEFHRDWYAFLGDLP